MDWLNILNQLCTERPIFANEADFQHALAWRIHLTYPDAKIRFEVRPPGTHIYLDLVVTHEGRRMAFELKYLKRRLEVEIGGELFSLSDDSVQDQGRYDVLKDVQRLEEVVSEGFADEGIAICLTNDFNYWNPPAQPKPTIFEAFRLTEGRRITGELTWREGASSGSIGGRTDPIQLLGDYTISWQPYSMVPVESNGEFKYLSFQITRA